MTKKILLWLGIGGLAAALAFGIVTRLHQAKAASATVRKPLTVTVTAARQYDWPVRIVYPADLLPYQRTLLVPQDIRGHIKAMYVDKGDDVKAGQRLVDIDCPDQADAQARQEQELKAAEDQYRKEKQLTDRMRPMVLGKFVPQEQYDEEVARRDAADATVARMKAELDESEATLDFCHIDAPYTGTITARYLDPGNEVEPNTTPVLEMMDTSIIRVMVHIDEDDLRFVHRGLPVQLTVRALPNHPPFQGTVTRVVQSVDPTTRLELVEADLPNPNGLLKPGEYGDLAIVVATHPHATIVPDIAVVQQQTGDMLFVEAGGVAHQRDVHVVYDDGTFAEIAPDPDPSKTVRPGEKVIFAGKDLTADGSRVTATVDDHLWAALPPSVAGTAAARPSASVTGMTVDRPSLARGR